ncbi:MAG TPA: indole-3-glycerol phosphate synthase TrpC [Candidatus Limnocylindria bacterium]|nr:indole-3-glycerol phosphate synthase TrpC [Candidatus Limnocylindria bacterium]
MTDFLEQVIAERRADVAVAKAATSEEELLSAAKDNLHSARRGRGVTPVSPGHDAFTYAVWRAPGRLAVIAEIKRLSPSQGVLLADADPATIARWYVEAGASAISVLTEPNHWGGSLRDLAAVRDAVRVPILCKDVIVDEFQIVQARSAGADAVLLIAEALSDEELRGFIARASALGMGVLVEAHEPVAFGRAVATRAPVVGVNARNLRRPREIDIGRVRQLHTFVDQHQRLVAESGITTVEDARLLPQRVSAVLIGSALMLADDPRPLIRGIAGIDPRPASLDAKVLR